MLAGSKNSPETDCLTNQNDTKSSLSDFFTSTVKGSPAGWAAMRSRMACDVLMAASVLDNLPKYLTVHKAHVVNKKPLRLSSGNQGRRTPPAKRRLVRKLPTLKW